MFNNTANIAGKNQPFLPDSQKSLEDAGKKLARRILTTCWSSFLSLLHNALGSFLSAVKAAKARGLVSDVVWPDRFLEEIVPRIESLAHSNVDALKATKSLLKRRLRERFNEVAEEETKLLVASWTGASFAKNLKRYLQSGACNVILQ